MEGDGKHVFSHVMRNGSSALLLCLLDKNDGCLNSIPDLVNVNLLGQDWGISLNPEALVIIMLTEV